MGYVLLFHQQSPTSNRTHQIGLTQDSRDTYKGVIDNWRNITKIWMHEKERQGSKVKCGTYY